MTLTNNCECAVTGECLCEEACSSGEMPLCECACDTCETEYIACACGGNCACKDNNWDFEE